MYQTAMELAPIAAPPAIALAMYLFGRYIGSNEQKRKTARELDAMRSNLRLSHKSRFRLEQKLANSRARTQQIEKELTQHKEQQTLDRYTLLRAARELMTASKTYQAMKSSHALTVARISEECSTIAGRNQPAFSAPATADGNTQPQEKAA